jgi:16S rRNA G1207 methylase RsmC
MLELAKVQAWHRVLEPSCGKGDLLDALKAQHPDLVYHALELNQALADVLAAKGYRVQFSDFLAHDGVYERIVMNPPFEHGQDMLHIQHAYRLLASGGRLVSVLSEGPFFRSDKPSLTFRAWLEQVGGRSEPLPEDAFQGVDAFRQTAVRTRLLTIDKE